MSLKPITPNLQTLNLIAACSSQEAVRLAGSQGGLSEFSRRLIPDFRAFARSLRLHARCLIPKPQARSHVVLQFGGRVI